MLNDTIYPFINKLIDKKINATESEFVLLDAPTLFEAGADKLCSVIVSVVADFGTRLERITKRDGISAELAKSVFLLSILWNFSRLTAISSLRTTAL